MPKSDVCVCGGDVCVCVGEGEVGVGVEVGNFLPSYHSDTPIFSHFFHQLHCGYTMNTFTIGTLVSDSFVLQWSHQSG